MLKYPWKRGNFSLFINLFIMSGHSKWATTRRKKESIDAKRSASFTKLANIISIAARSGGDPETNFKLRIAIDKAKDCSLPKENIDRAIKRGTGELGGNQIEEMIYEGFGPNGVAIVMEIMTDNKNRTAADVKHILLKYGGALGGPGSTMWMFTQQGVLELAVEKITDEQELELIDSGVEDIKTDGGVTLFCSMENFEKVKTKVESLGLKIDDASLQYLAKEKVTAGNKEETIEKLFDELEACDDVKDFYSNVDL